MSMPSGRWARLARVASATLLSATGLIALVPSAAHADSGALVTADGCRTNVVPRNDDGSYAAGSLPSTFDFYDRQLSSVFVNNNGNLTFLSGLTAFDGQISSFNTPLVAPFFADVDTRGGGSAPVTYGTTTFEGHDAFCATWAGVGRFNTNDSALNSFQVLLVDRKDVAAGDFDIVFNYGAILWDTASGSSPGQIGFSAGDGRSEGVYVFRGSGTAGTFLDSNTATGLVHGSRGSSVPGRYVFRFRDGRPAGITAPDTSITAAPPARSTSRTAAFTYASTVAADERLRFECRLTTASSTPAFAACADAGTSYAGLADGTYTFEVRAVDVFYSTDSTPASTTFTVDTTGPALTFDETPAALGKDNVASFAWSSQDTDVTSTQCNLGLADSIEPSPWFDCTDTYEVGPLGDGDWVFQVRGTDDLANTGAPTSYAFTVDTVAPDVTFTQTPDERGTDSSPVVEWTTSADTAGTECRLTGPGTEPAWASCASGDALDGLADGEWTFEVRASDHAGNTGEAASHTFTIDTAGPDVVLGEKPRALGNDGSPVLTWSSEATDVTGYECSLDEGEWAACASGDAFGPLDDGDHTFRVRAADDLGNVGAVTSYDFAVDTVVPDVMLTSTPERLTSTSTPTFAWSSEAEDVVSYECRASDGERAPWTDCASGDALPELADGDWTFEVRAIDAAGNASNPASYDFTVDTTAPGAPVLTSKPKALGNLATPSFAWTADADVDHFMCAVVPVGAQFATPVTCGAAGFTSEHLADGDYRFTVVAVDAAGNESEPTWFEFAVDTVAPGTTITSAPEAVVGTGSLTFGFAADESPSTFECRLSGAQQSAWETCAGASRTFSGLADGTYVFEVRATDAAGNTDATPAARTVKVNLGQPTITAAVTSPTPMSEFGWYRSPVTITYTCAGNGSALVGACPAPRQVPRAQQGRVVFRASIATADGDTASVSTTLFVDKGKPRARITGFSGKKVYSSMPKPRCRASDPRSGLDSCTVTVTKVKRTNGDVFVVVKAKAVDKAGNVRVVRRQAPFRAA